MRTCLVVLGTHRSGTSALTRTINILGATLPKKLLTAGSDNKLGFWEPEELITLNDEVLSALGQTWFDWTKFDLMPELFDRVTEPFLEKIENCIVDNYDDADMFVLKDPRICRLVPLYQKALENVGADARYILSVRKPLEVALSLKKRNNFPITQGLILWLRNVLESERATREYKRSIVYYDDLLSDWETVATQIADSLKIVWKTDFASARESTSTFLSDKHKHHHADTVQTQPELEPLLSWCDDVFGLMGSSNTRKSQKALDAMFERMETVSNSLYYHHKAILAEPGPHISPLEANIQKIQNSLRLESNTNRFTNEHLKAELAELGDSLTVRLRELEDNHKHQEALATENKLLQAKLKEAQESQQQIELHAQKAKQFAEERFDSVVGRLEQLESENLRLTSELDEAENLWLKMVENLDETENDGANTMQNRKIDDSGKPLSRVTADSHQITKSRGVQKFDVVIPVHNSVHWLAVCLEELFKIDHENLAEVVVVDDRSEPSQAARVEKIVARYPQVKLVTNIEETGGFGHTCNLGAEYCSAPNIIFLNTDCLVTEFVLDWLSETLELNDDVAMACPFSNNSPLLTYPMFPGRTYSDMAKLIREACLSSGDKHVLEACTIVGNCLAVKRDYFTYVGGFAPEWKEGYGEETELQMKALSFGLRSVVDMRCYVYHFGGGTFNYLDNVEDLRASNHKRFMSKWKKKYLSLERRVKLENPLVKIDETISNYLSITNTVFEQIELDVLFYLPGVRQDIGGLSAVIGICNTLNLLGVRANCALVGPAAAEGVKTYKEPVYFNFLTYFSDDEFLNDNVVKPKLVVSTIFTSAKIVAEFAKHRRAKSAQFIQGYEVFFENGTRIDEAIASYHETREILTTSEWLASMVSRHLQPDQTLTRLPLLPNQDIFFPTVQQRPIDFCMVLRGGPDKGQWLLMEYLHRLKEEGYKVAVIASPDYLPALKRYQGDIEVHESPLDHYTIGRLFRRVKVFVDASHHEGFGLLPLEAGLSGCQIVVSDSGGVRGLRGEFPVSILPITADPTDFMQAMKIALTEACQTQMTDEDVVPFEQVGERASAWADTIIRVGENVTPRLRRPANPNGGDALPVLKKRLTPAKALAVMRDPTSSPKAKVKRVGISIYRRTLRKVLPHRLRIALRVLFLGR